MIELTRNLLYPTDPDAARGAPHDNRKMLEACRKPVLDLLRKCEEEGRASGVSEFDVVGGIACMAKIRDDSFVIAHYVDLNPDGTATVRVWNSSNPANATEEPVWVHLYECNDTDEIILALQCDLVPFIRSLVDGRSLTAS
jgi:hypothetical protein